jgi:VIT1/CCC1 family predicted Fe2+/Mn2+ transporter
MNELKHRDLNPDFLHHQHSPAYLYGREIVFGMQDGMVSTLGALTGIAVGSGDHFIVLLSGISVITAASVSMAIGTYNSLSTEKKIERRILDEERTEIENSPVEEKEEILKMFIRDGWPEETAKKMASVAAQNDALMLREMAYRELAISTEQIFEPKKKAVVMFFAWAAGGLIPLLPYFFLSVIEGVFVSVLLTLFGLFFLGAVMSRFTKQKTFMAGAEMFAFGGMALVVGYSSGKLIDMFVNH